MRQFFYSLLRRRLFASERKVTLFIFGRTRWFERFRMAFAGDGICSKHERRIILDFSQCNCFSSSVGRKTRGYTIFSSFIYSHSTRSVLLFCACAGSRNCVRNALVRAGFPATNVLMGESPLVYFSRLRVAIRFNQLRHLWSHIKKELTEHITCRVDMQNKAEVNEFCQPHINSNLSHIKSNNMVVRKVNQRQP